MKKIIIAIFIVIATLGIAAGTTAKKAPVKTTSKTTTTTKKAPAAPKKEVTDPYVGWWYHAYDEVLESENGDDQDMLMYITKENGKYYAKKYDYRPKEKGAKICKIYNGTIKEPFENVEELKSVLKVFNKRATKEQLEIVKYNFANAKWISLCD